MEKLQTLFIRKFPYLDDDRPFTLNDIATALLTEGYSYLIQQND
ncbi:MAG: hypothetical protein ACHP6I_00720 [Rickettsiales bacterium]